MHCPFCGQDDTRVVDSRLVGQGSQVRRRRECQACKERFTTFEMAELAMPRVIKRDGRRTPFDEDKLRAGILRACEKRPIATEALDALMQRILTAVRQTGEREVSSMFLGQTVMDALRELDQVAYVRFASVYRSFEDVSAFRDVISGLENPTNATKEST